MVLQGHGDSIPPGRDKPATRHTPPDPAGSQCNVVPHAGGPTGKRTLSFRGRGSGGGADASPGKRTQAPHWIGRGRRGHSRRGRDSGGTRASRKPAGLARVPRPLGTDRQRACRRFPTRPFYVPGPNRTSDSGVLPPSCRPGNCFGPLHFRRSRSPKRRVRPPMSPAEAASGANASKKIPRLPG